MTDRWVVRIVDGGGGTAGWLASLDALVAGDRAGVATPCEWEALRFSSLEELQAGGDDLRDAMVAVGAISDVCVLSLDRAMPRVESPGSCPSCGSDEVVTSGAAARQCTRCGHRWDRFHPGSSVA